MASLCYKYQKLKPIINVCIEIEGCPFDRQKHFINMLFPPITPLYEQRINLYPKSAQTFYYLFIHVLYIV